MNRFTIIDDVFDDDDKYNQVKTPLNFVGHPRGNESDIMFKQRVGGGINDRPDSVSMMVSDMNKARSHHHPVQSSQQQLSQPSSSTAFHSAPHFHRDELQCRDIFEHIENCPICNSYVKRDIKFYWLIIAILVILILTLTKK